jgi:hypothetical protein
VASAEAEASGGVRMVAGGVSPAFALAAPAARAATTSRAASCALPMRATTCHTPQATKVAALATPIKEQASPSDESPAIPRASGSRPLAFSEGAWLPLFGARDSHSVDMGLQSAAMMRLSDDLEAERITHAPMS